jgi:crotonobetainyl-CoA:carnitine CoA-transferase CaiB-like acyl-CoA transferase
MSVTGLPGQGPVRVGIPIADLTAGIFLSQGILLALIAREKTGRGQWVHTSLLEAQIQMLDFQAARWLIAKEVAPQAGNDHPTSIPTGVYTTADGHINIAASGDTMFRRLCNTLGAHDLPEREEFKNGRLRSQNRHELHAILDKLMAGKTSAEWIEILNEASVPSGPIYSVDQTMQDVQVQHLGIARPLEHHRLGHMEVLGQAVTMRGSGGRPKIRKGAPDSGQHTAEILGSIGYSDDDVSKLKTAGVI